MMNRRFSFSLLIPLLLVGSVIVQGQVAHTLYGDFKVEEGRASVNKSGNFQIILYSLNGQIVARQNITNGGRYYFTRVSNGEYQLAVEMEGAEVTRIPITLSYNTSTEIRHNIEMEWRDVIAKSRTKSAAILSAADFYDRPPASQKIFDKAQEAVSKKEYKQAVSLLNQIVSTDSRDYQAWTELGTAYFRQEKNSEAEKAFRNALAAKPDYRLALLNLGKLYFFQKNYEAAIDLLTKAAEADPRSAETNLLLGESYLQIKKGSKAVGYLNEAIRLDPVGMAEAHLRLATLYRAAGLKDKAVAEYEQFLAKRPDHPDKEKIRQFIAENKKQ